ncbi:MAG TPA: glycerophosphodiester phosphodiesterase family protein [Alphaproteobacteria bacterium]
MIRVLGHRGVRHGKGFTENTLPSFEEALLHADGLETDVVVSADGVAYLLHDSAIRFIPHLVSWATYGFGAYLDDASHAFAASRHIEDMVSADIDRLRFKDGNHIPKISDLFNHIAANPAMRDKVINLELKAPGSARAVAAAVEKAVEAGNIRISQIVVSSFDHDELQKIRQFTPILRRAPIFWQDSVKPCLLYPWREGNETRTKPVSIANLEAPAIQKILPDYFVLPAHGLTNIYLTAVKDLYPNASFAVWTAGTEPLPEKNKALQRILHDPGMRQSLSAVITNHPGPMKKFIGGPG